MKKLLNVILTFVLVSPLMAEDLSSNTDISITKAWSQEPAGWTYPMAISVPDGPTPNGGWPVCILLHGFGSNGQGFLGQFRQLLDCHVLVGPTGYQNSWNICSEPSEAPDVEMVEELIEAIQSYDNVNADRIQILGVSNGSSLANNVLIRMTTPGSRPSFRWSRSSPSSSFVMMSSTVPVARPIPTRIHAATTHPSS